MSAELKCKIYFIYENYKGWITFNEYIKSINAKLSIFYNEKEYLIQISSLLKCNIEQILPNQNRNYCYDIGNRFKNYYSEIEIIEKTTVVDRNKNIKGYVFRCLKCENIETISEERLKENRGCKICSSRKIIKGFNDIWTTHPDIATQLANPDDGYKYTIHNDVCLDWKCQRCGYIIKNKQVGYVYRCGISCPQCADGISYPNKFMFSVLNQLNVKYNHEAKFDWSDGKRYDFVIPSLDTIIEVQGLQHYKECNKFNQTLEEERQNDKYKKQIAFDNGIKHYIEIDASLSQLEYMKQSILSSTLNQLFDLSQIDWQDCESYSLKSMVTETCNLWLSGMHNTLEISKILDISLTSVQRNLKRGTNIGLCNYDSKEERRLAGKKQGLAKGVKVICVTTDKIFNSISQASLYYHTNTSYIKLCCNGIRKYAGKLKDGTKLVWNYIN
jgi:hypothetical protein